MATATPQAPDTTRPDAPPPRGWWPAVLSAVIVMLLAGGLIWLWPGGDDTPSPVTTPTTTPTDSTTPSSASTSSTTPTSVPVTADVPSTLFFMGDNLRNSFVAGPHLVPVGRMAAVPAEGDTAAHVEAVVTALAGGVISADEESGLRLTSSIPAGTEVLDVTISGRTATIDFSSRFEEGGGSFDMRARLAQVVFTATAVSGVDAVVFAIEGDPVSVFSGEGIVLDGPQTRDDWTDLLPQIMVEAPLPGAEVTSPISMRGLADVFEATVSYRLETDSGEVLAEGFTMTLCGQGCFGEFAERILFRVDSPTPGRLVAFQASAENGQPTNIYTVPLVLMPGGEAPPDANPTERKYNVDVDQLLAEPLVGNVVAEAPYGTEAGQVGFSESGWGPCCFDVYDIDSVVVLDAGNQRIVKWEAGEEPVVLTQFQPDDFVPVALAAISDRVVVVGMTNRPDRPHDAVTISIETGSVLDRVETTVVENIDLRATTDGVYWTMAAAHPVWTAIADSSGSLLQPAAQVTFDLLPGEATLDVYHDTDLEVRVQPAGDSLRTTYNVEARDVFFTEVLGIQRWADGAIVVLGDEYSLDSRAAVRVLELGTPPDNLLSANLYSFEIQRSAETGIFNTFRYAFGGLYVLNTTPQGMEIVRYDF